jgi:phosphatidylglycerophosphatase A
MTEHTPPLVNTRFLLSHPAHFIALGFGSGLAPKAPGTVGTLWAWATWLVLQNFFSPSTQGLIIALCLPIGWWACSVTSKNMGIADPGAIVWDEFIAMWLILWFILPTGFVGQFVAFVLFRFFDAVKPPPVAWADQLFKGFGWRGAWGILFDDLVAAACTLLLIAVWRWLW